MFAEETRACLLESLALRSRRGISSARNDPRRQAEGRRRGREAKEGAGGRKKGERKEEAMLVRAGAFGGNFRERYSIGFMVEKSTVTVSCFHARPVSL